MFDIDKNILELKETGIQPISKDEIFIQVNNTSNYWISNYGRLVNNLRKNFYLHKTGNVHWTIQGYYLAGTKCPRDTFPNDLVAEHFLEKVKGKNRIWNIDGDKTNNYYKNLIYVDDQEYYDLNTGRISSSELGRQQEYIPYIAAHKNRAYSIYNGIYKRCYDLEFKKQYPHYKEATMYDSWKKDYEVFTEWYEANYYECDGESMQVDKDLLYQGNKEYHPLKCCILPQSINVFLSNCKKHYYKDDGSVLSRQNNNLPLGVRYDSSREKYYSQIKVDNEIITLSYWDTSIQAFEEYKKHKEAQLLVMADRYKNKIPKRIYDALLLVQIEPY